MICVLLYIIASFLTLVILKLYFSSFFESKAFSIGNLMVWSLYFLRELLLFMVIDFPANINLITGFLLNCFICIIAFRGNVIQQIALSGILSTIWTLSEFFVGCFFLAVGVDYQYPKAIGAIVSEVMTLLMIACLNRFFQHENIKALSVKHNIMLLLIPIGSLFVVYKVFMSSSSYANKVSLKEPILCFIIILVINLIVFRLYTLLADEMEQRRYNAVYTQQLELYSKHIQEKETSLLEFRNAKHDMKQHFILLLGMLEENQNEMAKKYLSDLVDNNDYANFNISRTDNLVVDAIINAKYSVMQKNNIKCEINVHIPMQLPFENADVSVLLGNVIDNAIEAASKISSNRFIKIYMSYDKNILLITVINSFDGGIIRDKSGKLKTSKKDKHNHGFGLNSIEKIVHKYHGSVVIENSLSEFKIKMMLLDMGQRLHSTS